MTRVALAAERLDELQALLAGGGSQEINQAAERLRAAVDQAAAALLVARGEGVDSTRLAALESRLRDIVTSAGELVASAQGTIGRAAGTSLSGNVPAGRSDDQVAALEPLTRLPVTTGAAGAPATTAPPATTTTLLPPLPQVPGVVPGVVPGLSWLGTGSTTTTTTAPPDAEHLKKLRDRLREERRRRQQGIRVPGGLLG